MRLTITTAFGDPDAATPFMLKFKRSLRDRAATLRIDGLEEVDLFFRVGGSITPAEGDGGVHNLRRRKSDGRISANLVFPASELTAGEATTVMRYLDELADRVGARLQAAGHVGDEAAVQLRRAIALAFADATLVAIAPSAALQHE